jgi:hypothetical protein
MATSFFTRIFDSLTQRIDQRIGWDKLPLPLGLLTLIGLRDVLRAQNLYDTSPGLLSTPPANPEPESHYLTARTADGTYNDLTQPLMGSAGTRFGRNVPPKNTFPDTATVLEPNPRTISTTLLAREDFQPATTLNLLAAAWVQFMIHDWFSHGPNQKENPWKVPLEDNDPWPEHPMTILRTRSDSTQTPGSGAPPTFLNTETHWWDGSQIYGSSAVQMQRMRSGKDGKLLIGDDGLLPVDPTTGTDLASVSGNWWIGLSMLHTLFTLEHNSICNMLLANYPTWSDDQLYNHARLVNAALMAKIHTIDWTPAILDHPTMQVAMHANWWGLAGQWINDHFGRISTSEVISGIPGSATDHFGVPYSLTEEFVAVYRMHPLMPDEFSLRSLADNSILQQLTLPEVADTNARTVVEQISMADLFYSFGTSYPGAITLHNYPRYLRERREPDGSLIDLATTEIIRDRERGVPRYNEFRQLMHRTPVKTFEEVTDNPEWAKQLRQVYNNDIDKLDLMVGMYAEPRPQGFGFSDTAFRIFILMASRRLNSDRFFTKDYRPEVYTPQGFQWVVENNMSTLLQRHFPALKPFLLKVQNPFAPWPHAPHE